MIYLIDSPVLAAKLRDYPEDFRFAISNGATGSLRDGIRTQQLNTNFSAAFTSSVMIKSAAEAIYEERARATQRRGYPIRLVLYHGPNSQPPIKAALFKANEEKAKPVI